MPDSSFGLCELRLPVFEVCECVCVGGMMQQVDQGVSDDECLYVYIRICGTFMLV